MSTASAASQASHPAPNVQPPLQTTPALCGKLRSAVRQSLRLRNLATLGILLRAHPKMSSRQRRALVVE